MSTLVPEPVVDRWLAVHRVTRAVVCRMCYGEQYVLACECDDQECEHDCVHCECSDPGCDHVTEQDGTCPDCAGTGVEDVRVKPGEPVGRLAEWPGP